MAAQLVSENMEHAVDRMFEPCYLEPFNPDVKLSFKDGNFDSLTKNERDEIYQLCSDYEIIFAIKRGNLHKHQWGFSLMSF